MSARRPGLADSVLRRIRTEADFFDYLIEELDWPIDTSAQFEIEQLTWEWLPADIGIETEHVRSLGRLRQLRPLTENQPWGVFFVEFDGERLPVTQFRKVAQAFARRPRPTATSGDNRPRWDLENLLFVVTTGRSETVQLHLLALWNNQGRADEIRSLAWRPRQASRRHLQRLHEELLPCLNWPPDNADESAWVEQWRGAFALPHGAVISTAAMLAERMAVCARDLRIQIAEALADEAGAGPFSTMLARVRAELVADADAAKFADMCAQTLVYGLLSSRVTSPEDFGTSPVYSTVPLSNRFLEAFFEQVHDEASVLDLAGSGLDQLIADLKVSNVEAILDQFGTTAKGGDPVIHFYEEFLKQYDRKLRADAGAFYTPQPVVDFMVRAVDEVLRTRFGLAMGIADPSTWSSVAEQNGFEVPDSVEPTAPFVSMIDPATGTGTYLVAWINQAKKSFLDGGGRPADWPWHLREHVLPSMHGFELMLGPYAIAHLKVALELHSHGVPDADARVLLTNSLEHQPAETQFETMTDPISAEGRDAATLKADERFSVVVGNPPYDREQRSATDEGKRKGGIVRHGAPGINPLLNAVTEPMQAAGLGKHLKNVYNDYVYFWRWAVWQATELPPGPGVVAFITASSYLDGVSMGGVRQLLRQAFDELWIVDLGGEGRGAHKEENVFDIQTPVAIALGVRNGTERTTACDVRYRRVEGSRDDKFSRLRRMKFSGRFEQVPGEGMDHLTLLSGDDYFDWPEITDLFPWIHSGSQLKRTWPIAEAKSLLERRWSDLTSAVPRRRADLLKETRDRKATSRVAPLLGGQDRLRSLRSLDRAEGHEGLARYGYRSFDRQWVIADHRVADYPRPDLWRVRGRHQVFLTTLTSTKLGWGPVLTVSPYVPDLDHFSGRGAKNAVPLYRDPKGEKANVTDDVLVALGDALGTAPTAEDLLAYVYALGGTAAFSEQFEHQLAEAAGPVHFPITSDPALFAEAAALGRDLLWWHTWGERFAPKKKAKLPDGRAAEVVAVSGMPETFQYDPESEELTVGTGIFAPVSPEAWGFEVSGLRVLPSWIGYRMKIRKGRKSSELDNIRPTRWTQSKELLLLLSILEHTIEVTPHATQLLGQIVNGPLIPAAELPRPAASERKPHKSR